ncbi:MULTISPECIES: M56 family metallopeptidase [Odoribacteraceae]|uniref:M56 family metallopeptidase n=1 Tax=Odoribacteraceae TaxID=1853231 RepID=UPI000E479D05|nr:MULTISPECIES: M56 family metallopeptidase [Odoribacteraceae]MCQ4875529.1 M56 family peptidase [Butyricimonas paravirosa]RHR82691.1 M56 family peptidase [Odoribacter sp. AF15-53]
MGTFFVYILKASVCLAAFYLFYRLLLSKDTFHRFNRIALLGILFLSLVIPFCEITVHENIEVQQTLLDIEQLLALADNTPQLIQQPTISSIPLWIPVLLFTYFSGILFFFGRNIYSLFHMLHLLHGGKKEKLEKSITLVTHDKNIAPFSWMKYVVISEKDLRENSKEILTHELAHIHNRHSIDLFISEICICFQWFNPASWLLKQELQNIHEYEADETVIRQGINAKQYQLLIIKKAVGTRLYSMANSFNHSKLKKRITMMLKEKSSPWARVKYLYVLPIAAITLTAFARPEITNELNEISAIKVNDITSILETNKVNNSVLEVDSTKKSTVQQHQSKNYFILQKDSTQKKSGTTKIKIREEDDSATPKESLIEITQAFLVPNDSTHTSQITLSSLGLLIVNGKEVSMDSIQKIDQSRIKTITVLKDKTARTLYGDKAKNGVISISIASENDPTITNLYYNLVDGTTVLLNPKTTTKTATYMVTQKDASNSKKVELKGEAYFSVVSADSLVMYTIACDTIVMTSDTLKIEKKK